MLKTRKIALNKKKKVDNFNLTDIWHEEFLKLHPDYKSSKKNLWRKYRWYKNRMSIGEDQKPADNIKSEFSNIKPESFFNNAELKKEADVKMIDMNQQPMLKMKNIRKDVFNYLKAVMEEARIFLPTKLPSAYEDNSASQKLAAMHQQAMIGNSIT